MFWAEVLALRFEAGVGVDGGICEAALTALSFHTGSTTCNSFLAQDFPFLLVGKIEVGSKMFPLTVPFADCMFHCF